MTVPSPQSFQTMALQSITFWDPSPLSSSTATAVYYHLFPSSSMRVHFLQHWQDQPIVQHMIVSANLKTLLCCSGQCLKVTQGWVPSAQGRTQLSATQSTLQPPATKILSFMPSTIRKKKILQNNMKQCLTMFLCDYQAESIQLQEVNFSRDKFNPLQQSFIISVINGLLQLGSIYIKIIG